MRIGIGDPMGGAPATGEAVVVDGIAKQYRLGGAVAGYRTMREAIGDAIRAPLRQLRRFGDSRMGLGGETFWALDDVSFSVREGEVVGIIGRNGAGKSTLLKILSRITEPTRGSARIRGRVASLLEVGTGFHPELSGRENIFLNGAILGMRRAEIRRRFDEIVEFAEIGRFLDTPVKRYSSGMYVRLAFAVAAHLDPEILIVDEVLAVGDAMFQKKCLGKMRDVTQSGRTVLFVSHNLAAVTSLCQRTVLLEGGKVVFDGPAEEGVTRFVSSALPTEALGWDLSKIRRERAELRQTAELLECRACPQAEGVFRVDEPLRFALTWRPQRAVEGLIVVVNVDDMNGTRIATFETEASALGIDPEPGRTYTVEVTASGTRFVPGRYQLSASLYSGLQWYDYVRHFGVFEISNLMHGRDETYVVRPGAGVIDVPTHWRLLPDARWEPEAQPDPEAALTGGAL